MEVWVEEDEKPWIEKRTKRRLVFLVIFILLFQLFKYNETALGLYKHLYFRTISPWISSIAKAFEFSYICVLVILILKLLGAFLKFNLKTIVNRLLRFVSGLFIAFMLFWGFNYASSDLVQNPNPVSVEDLFNLSVEKTEELLFLTEASAYSEGSLTMKEKQTLNTSLKEITIELFPKVKLMPKLVEVRGDGFLRKIGISGIFFPFTHQPLYDDSAPFITKRFTYCHEYFHAISVTGEDECNALAFHTLMASGSDKAKLSGYLDVLRTCANVMGYSREDLKDKVGKKTYALLEFIWEDAKKYTTSFHEYSRKSNDLYLKSLGSEGGVDSYSGYLNFLKIENNEISLYLEGEIQI